MGTTPIILKRSVDSFFSHGLDTTLVVQAEAFSMNGDTMDRRLRPTRIAGFARSAGSRARADLVCLADLRSDNVADVRNPTFGIGGHLIAVSLDGVDAPPNLVPVSKRTNDQMSSVEAELRKLCTGPRHLEVLIPEYYGADKDTRVPRKFVYRLYAKPGPPGPENPLTNEWEVVQDWLCARPYGYDAALINTAQQAATIVQSTGWAIERIPGFTGLAGKLPPIDRRPLAFVDYLAIHNPAVLDLTPPVQAEFLGSISSGGLFTGLSRRLAILGNVLIHNNWLVSDAYQNKHEVLETGAGALFEGFQLLVDGGGLDAPHIDHIVPRSKGGPNCLSNAQVTSHAFNVQKGNHTARLELRDQQWRDDMAAKLRLDPKLKGFV